MWWINKMSGDDLKMMGAIENMQNESVDFEQKQDNFFNKAVFLFLH